VYAEPEFYVDQFYDQVTYMDSEEGEDGGLSSFSLVELLQHCVQPTVVDGLKHMFKIIGWSLIFRLICSVKFLPSWSKHVASIITGSVLAHMFFLESVGYLVVLVVVSYLVILVSPGYRGPVVAAAVLSYNLGCETWVSEAVTWHQVRGAIMIASMKIISVGFDLDVGEGCGRKPQDQDQDATLVQEDTKGEEERKNYNLRNRKSTNNKDKQDPHTEHPTDHTDVKHKLKHEQSLPSLPHFVEFVGYCMCPGSIVLGPWTSFQDYDRIIKHPTRFSFNWLFKMLWSVAVAFFFLTISTCVSGWFIPSSPSSWLNAYRDALSFRSSHYFVSFMSEASAISAGLGALMVNGKEEWGLEVSEPHKIEVARSLVQVVISWNLPMHAWLKKYVFKQARNTFGAGVAVVATYCASTILHGLSGQLAAVLFSLGLYTWVEHSFRKKLANILNASIETKPDTKGKYKYTESCGWVIIINFVFGLLTLFHLAYLGVMFDQSESSTTGYSWHHTLDKWSRLGFRSHFVVLAMMILNWIL